MLTSTLGVALRSPKLVGMSAITLCLSACGGGGGGSSGGVASTPPPPPPPTYTQIFPNVTQSTNFATLGYEASAIPASALVGDGFAVRYDAGAGAYMIDVPAWNEGKFRLNSQSGSSWFGDIESTGSTHCCATVLKPSSGGLSFTTFADYGELDFADNLVGEIGVIAFGTATTPGNVPTSGSATFDAIVRGTVMDSGRAVQGTASLQFNLGAGTLTGSFNPSTYNSVGTLVGLGTYSFVNTSFGVGSTTFSGELQHAGTVNLGVFNGLFTGPAAQELMARWTAPYLNPDNGQWKEMFGVWVGKKQ